MPMQAGVLPMPMQQTGVLPMPMQQTGVLPMPMQQTGVLPMPMQQTGVLPMPMQQTGVPVLPMSPVSAQLYQVGGLYAFCGLAQICYTPSLCSMAGPRPTKLMAQVASATMDDGQWCATQSTLESVVGVCSPFHIHLCLEHRIRKTVITTVNKRRHRRLGLSL
jgi:hypothetical protein